MNRTLSVTRLLFVLGIAISLFIADSAMARLLWIIGPDVLNETLFRQRLDRGIYAHIPATFWNYNPDGFGLFVSYLLGLVGIGLVVAIVSAIIYGLGELYDYVVPWKE